MTIEELAAKIRGALDLIEAQSKRKTETIVIQRLPGDYRCSDRPFEIRLFGTRADRFFVDECVSYPRFEHRWSQSDSGGYECVCGVTAGVSGEPGVPLSAECGQAMERLWDEPERPVNSRVEKETQMSKNPPDYRLPPCLVIAISQLRVDQRAILCNSKSSLANEVREHGRPIKYWTESSFRLRYPDEQQMLDNGTMSFDAAIVFADSVGPTCAGCGRVGEQTCVGGPLEDPTVLGETRGAFDESYPWRCCACCPGHEAPIEQDRAIVRAYDALLEERERRTIHLLETQTFHRYDPGFDVLHVVINGVAHGFEADRVMRSRRRVLADKIASKERAERLPIQIDAVEDHEAPEDAPSALTDMASLERLMERFRP